MTDFLLKMMDFILKMLDFTGKIELSGMERSHIDTLTAKMAVLEGRLTARYLWELEKQEKIDAARAIRQQKREAAAASGVNLRNETPIPAGPLDGTQDQLKLEDKDAVDASVKQAEVKASIAKHNPGPDAALEDTTSQHGSV